jgi:hypothetical protein
LVLPKANTDAMTRHLAEISTQVTKGAHAIVILDRAKWHVAHDLDVPDNISLLFLPPYSPELNPISSSGTTSSMPGSIKTMTISSMPAARPGQNSSIARENYNPSPQGHGQKRSMPRRVGLKGFSWRGVRK